MEIMSLMGDSVSRAQVEAAKEELFTAVMRADWNRVVDLYRTCPAVHKLKITRSGHTALHLAISDGQESIVALLVSIVAQNTGTARSALAAKNEIGCTPLHFAASMGSTAMCHTIVKVDPTLVTETNGKGETPLFWAVLYGQSAAFTCLDECCVSLEDGRDACCRRSLDGETILHCAILGEYFDLAYQIMVRYGKLVNFMNEEGLNPLHILATKPSAFKSGSNFGRWERIVYEWIYVDDEVTPEEAMRDQLWETSNNNGDNNKIIKSHPQNYSICVNFIELFLKAVRVVTNLDCTRGTPKADPEEPPQTRHPGLYPANYATCFQFAKFIYKALLVILGLGYTKIHKLKELKEKHMWANRVLERLIETAKLYDFEEPGGNPEAAGEQLDAFGAVARAESSSMLPVPHDVENSTSNNREKNTETAILVAARNGIVEIVEKVLRLYPVAIHDVNADNKNILLLAVEKRRIEVYKLLLKRNMLLGIMFRKVDSQWNSALHFAAALGGDHLPWPIPGAALQMQWEIKWFKYIESSMPPRFFLRTNKVGKTPEEVFTDSHKELVQSGGAWLTSTSTSCSVVAALIATVAFAGSTTIPGGVDQSSGKPTLRNQPAFDIFAVASLVALCFSVTSLVMFLAILTSRYQERDFGTDLPRKLLLGLTSLFVSITAMLCAFCAGHFFVLEDKLKSAAYPVYVVTSLPVTLFAAVQFPLYLDLVKATFWTPF